MLVVRQSPGVFGGSRVPLGPKTPSRRLGCPGDRPLQLASIPNPAMYCGLLTAGWTQEAGRDAVS